VKTVHVKFSYRFKALFETTERMVDLEDEAKIRDLLGVLCDTDAKRKGIFRTDGCLRHDVMLTRNGLFILHLDRLETNLEDGDSVNIFHPASMG
jgi:molybdopterin converting factor small subunit